MPKLIIHRPKKKKPVPPCGRRSEFTVPHSPFQILVDTKRQQLGFSTRELAENINEHLPPSRIVRQSTLWFWLHHKNGSPHPRALTTERLKAISKALSIPVDELKRTIDSSRLLFSQGQLPVPQPSMDALDSLIGILEHDRRVTLTRSFVLNLAKNIRAGANHVASNPPK